MVNPTELTFGYPLPYISDRGIVQESVIDEEHHSPEASESDKLAPLVQLQRQGLLNPDVLSRLYGLARQGVMSVADRNWTWKRLGTTYRLWRDAQSFYRKPALPKHLYCSRTWVVAFRPSNQHPPIRHQFFPLPITCTLGCENSGLSGP